MSIQEIANDAYYNSGEPILKDHEYDLISDNGLDTRNFRNKISHYSPMGSLRKIKSKDEFNKVIVDNKFHISPKLDGNSIELVFHYGNLYKCITRGNGFIGNDITDKIQHCNIYVNPDDSIEYDSFKCEAIMPKMYQKDYDKNIRNVASGILNKKEIEIPELNKIDVISFDTIGNEAYNFTYEDIAIQFDKWKEEYPYEIDGIVVKLLSEPYEETDELLPRNTFALKFNKDGILAEIGDIEWSLGKYGILYPVIVLKQPVDIDGTQVSRISASNFGIVKDAGLGINANIKVIKSGDIIPYISEVINRSDMLPPVFCPNCNNLPKLNENGIHLVCDNCVQDALTLLKHIFKVFDIDYISDSTIENLYQNGFTSIDDYFQAEVEDIESMEGFGRKTAEYIFYMLNTLELTEAEVLECTMIKGMGNKQCQKLIDHFGSIEKFLYSNDIYTQLEPMNGFAEKSINNIINNLDKFKDTYIQLSKYCKIHKNITSAINKGNIVFTGKCDKFNRKELTDHLKYQGWKIQTGVTSTTNLLLTDDIESSTGKTKKARELGIEIKSYDEFFKE